MEIYVLDNLLRRTEIVDKFKSLIWTERLNSYGDFQLIIPAENETKDILPPGTWIAMNESRRMMRVENVELRDDDDGDVLFFSGRSMEAILLDRVARSVWGNLTTTPKWILTGTPIEIANQIFNEICVQAVLNPGDTIPFYTPGDIYPEGTIEAPSEIITIELEPTTVYDAIKDICEMFDLGFRFSRNEDTSQVYFSVFTGTDRTSRQNDFPTVVFSPEMDNLHNTTELTTLENYKNVAYVFSNKGSTMYIPWWVDPEVEGFERRVLLIRMDEFEDEVTTQEATAAMIQKAKEELTKHRQMAAFDGELSHFSGYKYEVDYFMGDRVEMRNASGVLNEMQVTEQIFVSDEEGERSYPTLSLYMYVTPGSWLSWDYNQVWEDMGPTEYWENA